jgi:iron complex transport system substrate-binding protein
MSFRCPDGHTGCAAASVSRTLAGLILLAAAAIPAAAASSVRPERVVSLNLCADQLALEIAAPGQLAAVSYLAPDPRYSALAEQAQGLPTAGDNAESVIGFEPDLVLAGSFTTLRTQQVLGAMDVPVTRLPLTESFADVRANIALLGRALGREAAAERLQRQLDAALTRFPLPATPAGPLAAIYQANGFTAGAGTLADEVLRRAGFRNLGAETGIDGHGFLSVEALVRARPDVIVVESQQGEGLSMASRLLAHPALRDTVQGRMVALPMALLTCGGPFTVRAIERLAAARGIMFPETRR